VGKKYKRDLMKVGVLQFGNGEIESDGTVSQALTISPLNFDMKKTLAAIKKMKWQGGFTNMAQAFTGSEKMFMNGGRPGSLAQIVVITDGKPSFRYNTLKAVNTLRDKGTHVNMVVVHDHADHADVKLMAEWATVPSESHMIHIPGLKRLQASVDTFVTATLVQFCPRAESPKLMKKVEKKIGYELVVENKDCINWWWRIARYLPGKKARSLEDCKDAAAKAKAKYFVAGQTRYGFKCYAHKKNDGKCTAKKRPWMRKKGWVRSRLDMYRVMGLSGGGDAKAKFMLSEDGRETATEMDEFDRDNVEDVKAEDAEKMEDEEEDMELEDEDMDDAVDIKDRDAVYEMTDEEDVDDDEA